MHCSTLLCKILERSWLLVSAEVLGSVPHGYNEVTQVKFWGSQKLYVDFPCGVGVPTPALFKGEW